MVEKHFLNDTGLQSYHGKIMQEIANASAAVEDLSAAAISEHNADENAHANKFADYVPKTAIGASNGVAPIDENGKIPSNHIPDIVLGQVTFLGVWDVVNGVAISDSRNPAGRAYKNGDYYIATTSSSSTKEGSKVPNADGSSGSTASGNTYTDGDWLIFTGIWDKIDNTDAVTSVAGRTGAVVLSASDVGLGNVQNKTMDTTPKSGSGNYISSGAVYTELAKKQATLTFDSTPTANSNNPVKANGIYNWGVASFLPVTATVNGKYFDDSRNCNLTAADVGALAQADLNDYDQEIKAHIASEIASAITTTLNTAV